MSRRPSYLARLTLAHIVSDSEKANPITREGEQLKRYRASLPNLIFTDYLEFRWFFKGKQEIVGHLATLQGKKKLVPDLEGTKQVIHLLDAFMQTQTPTVSSPKELAVRIAAIAKLICDTIENVFKDTEEGPGSLQSQLDGFKQVLMPHLTIATFADMYAQTICYGLFAARCNHSTGVFTRRDAANDIPYTNPFLRKMFRYIADTELDERINWAVDSLAELLNRADIEVILKDFGKRTRQEDPVIHFYETFLTEYNPALRKKRGNYYTPEPVVSYIVRSVDQILKTTFALPEGIADSSKIQGKTADGTVVQETHRVQILDPATGTATFLYSTIDLIHESFQGNQGMWSSYVSRNLLPRLFGLELLMAPYAMAHMKLGLQLKETGYDFKSKERLRVYLTNTLEESYEGGKLPFVEWLVEEATAAGYAKHDAPVMVVLGNPPYNGHSTNKGKWITQLLRGEDIQTGRPTGNYFEVDGKPLEERNTKWLNNDYVKFLRVGQWRIERTGYGILAFITDNSYLDSPTFRGMRQSLMQTFDDIYILDLHGNSNKKERNIGGSRDQNVFDIQQGVAIGIFVKHREGKIGYATVHHTHLRGMREAKYQTLFSENILTTEWATLAPQSPSYFFIPQVIDLKTEYEQGWKITNIFGTGNEKTDQGKSWGLGVITHNDGLLLDFERTLVEKRLSLLASRESNEVVKEALYLEDTAYWNTTRERSKVRAYPWRNFILPYLYRPFNFRWICYEPNLMEIKRGGASKQVMHHLIAGKNIALLTTRQTQEPFGALCTRHPCAHKSLAAYDGTYVFPLYFYPELRQKGLFDTQITALEERHPNLAPPFIADLTSKLQIQFIPDGKGDCQTTIGPEDVFHYIYAVFYSQTYGSRYNDLLKRDFPYVPITTQIHLFRDLCLLGSGLVSLHLMEKHFSHTPKFDRSGSDMVDAVHYKDSFRIWINKEQCFEDIPPEVWNFQVGGYRVCERWLKDRKDRKLEFEDVRHYQQVVAALAETIPLMEQIDATIEKYGGWPIQ